MSNDRQYNIDRFWSILLMTANGYYSIMINYDRLWKTMNEKGITKYALIKKYGISPGQLTRLKRNESVSTNTIDKFCAILDCNVEDIMEYKR